MACKLLSVCERHRHIAYDSQRMRFRNWCVIDAIERFADSFEAAVVFRALATLQKRHELHKRNLS